MEKPIYIIAACDKKRGIGSKNDLPWERSLAKDLRFFNEMTRGNIVVMGRNTWESIPKAHRPLSDRVNIVVTRNADYEVPEKVHLATSYEMAIEFAQGLAGDQNVFICGGGEIYKLAIESGGVSKIYLTEVRGDFGCEVFFPDFGGYSEVSRSEVQTENGIEYEWVVYEKN